MTDDDTTPVQLFVPWRTDHGHREQLWHACMLYWGQLIPGLTVTIGDRVSDDPINRAAARNAAAAFNADGAPPWEVAVFADADVMVDKAWQVHTAIWQARRTGHLVYAHTWRAGFGPEVTQRIVEGDSPQQWLAARDEWDINTFSSCYAVPRALWDAVGGFDDRFVGWGFEDLAFMHACRTLAGVSRVEGVVYHLWHPRPREAQEGQRHYGANEALWRRYTAADGDPDAMRQVLAR